MPTDTPDARREIVLFLAILFALSGAVDVAVFAVPAVREGWLTYSAAFMWTPGLAALATKLLVRRSLRGLGWGWGGFRHYAFAYLFPLAFCLPVYLVSWLTPLGAFDAAAVETQRTRFGTGGVLAILAAQPFLGILATLGEEIGWRGLLVPGLARVTSLTRTSLITGGIWAVWHYPVVIAVLPQYLPELPLVYALTCFTVSVVAVSFVYTPLRLRSGSVWPAALLHSSSNAFMGAFEAATQHGVWTSYWTYEYGAGFAVVLSIIAFLLWRRRVGNA